VSRDDRRGLRRAGGRGPPYLPVAILFDEKIGGTVHVALGRSYPETGGTNMSALHWDLICDLREGGRLTADGQVIQENGHFK
jgi:aminopeptidase